MNINVISNKYLITFLEYGNLNEYDCNITANEIEKDGKRNR